MTTNKSIDTHIDTLGIRCICYSKYNRDNIFSKIITFIKAQHIVGIIPDKYKSTKYYQTTKLQYGNSTLATISKGYFEQTSKSECRAEYYYINISFYGLMRYNETIDNTSRLLVRTIAAYLNTKNIDFKLMELDLAMDIKSKFDNILAICTKRTANVNYYSLGDYSTDNKPIQPYYGTYNIEKYSLNKEEERSLAININNAKTTKEIKVVINNAKWKISKKIKNTMSRAYLYDKRYKELSKFKRDIGFDLTRFELKLQKRYFVKNKYDGSNLYKAMQKYRVLYFEDMMQKELFIQLYNNANTSRKRHKVLDVALESKSAVLLTYKLNNVYSFLREIDSITFDSQGNFKSVKHEDYLYCQSKFNRKLFF